MAFIISDNEIVTVGKLQYTNLLKAVYVLSLIIAQFTYEIHVEGQNSVVNIEGSCRVKEVNHSFHTNWVVLR